MFIMVGVLDISILLELPRSTHEVLFGITSLGVGTLPHFVEAHWDPPACGTLGRKAGPAAEGGALSPSKQQARPRSRSLFVDLRSEPRIDRLAPASSSAPDRTIGLRVGSE